MYVGTWAESTPDKAALVFDDDVIVTYAELDAASNRVARFLRDGVGLRPGDAIAVVLGNRPEFGMIWWAAMRSGLYITPVNWHLAPDEIAYVLADSGARVLFHSDEHTELVERVRATSSVDMIDVPLQSAAGGTSLAQILDTQSSERLDHETSGASMFYSSGTTGRPKGIRAPLVDVPPSEHTSLGVSVLRTYGITADDTYLSPGPLYHSSPSIWSFGMTAIGATAVIMHRFDAEHALRLIDRRRVTVSQWVPTMFSRMLALPDETRYAYDLSTHRVAYHASAPCPIEIKRRMIEWWGPILEEFYAGTEGGSTHITSEEWLERPGSVGRHWTGEEIIILDPATKERQPPGEEGLVYLPAMGNHRFEYHNAPDKTAATYHGDHVTLGDIGYVDDAGYLFLTDRQHNMIISGGVNIYPREIEELLVADSRIADAAVIGVPNPDLGEEVKAVIELLEPGANSADIERELIEACRARLGGLRAPRSIDIVDELPRDDNGKLYKRRIRDPYWHGHGSRIV